MQVQAYLFFDGRCEEALQYYSKHLGAKVEMLMRNKESPEPPPPGMNAPGEKVMHAAFRIGETQVLASDGMCSGKPKFDGFSLAISARDDATAVRCACRSPRPSSPRASACSPIASASAGW